MKNSILWGVAVFLAGMTIFGIFEALVLLKTNVGLRRSVGQLTAELETTRSALKQAKRSLSDSYVVGDKLGGDIRLLKQDYNALQKKFQGSLRKNSLLDGRLKELTEAQASLGLKNRQIGDRLLRLEFENEELRTIVSSKTKIRQVKRNRVAPKQALRFSPRPRKNAARAAGPRQVPEKTALKDTFAGVGEGNQGFVVRDGHSTLGRVVGVEVMTVN